MKTPPDDFDSVGLAAAEWIFRHDRGLTAAEQDEFSQWLAADPRNRAAWAEYRWGWDELDRLAGVQTTAQAMPDRDLLAPVKHRRSPFGSLRSRPASLVAAAAALLLGVVLWERPWRDGVPPASLEAPRPLALIEQRELADGSVVELNRSAALIEQFTPAVRRVQLIRGEAHFKVAKNPQRPFVVEAAGVTVRAVGTAFNVQLGSTVVEILVTEGKVAVAPAAEDARPDDSGSSVGSFLEAGERATIALAPNSPAPKVETMLPGDIQTRLAWRPQMLDFTNAPLAEILAEFNRRNPVHLTMGDNSQDGLRLSATFRSDNVEGFVRLLASDFGMRVERRGEAMIVLHPVSAPRKP